MKKISLVVLILLVGFACYAEGLNKDAQQLKNEAPDIYEVVKQRAIDEWNGDHTMILYIINEQCKAMYSCAELVNDHELIVKTQLVEWCEGDIFKYESAYFAPIDWLMVLYCSKEQIKAQAGY